MITYGNKVVSKLTSEQVAELRKTRPAENRGEWYKTMGAKYGVCAVTVMRACNRRTYGIVE